MPQTHPIARVALTTATALAVLASLAGRTGAQEVSRPDGRLEGRLEIGAPVAPEALRAAVEAGRARRPGRRQILAAPFRTGAMAGRRIVVSAGHGTRWDATNGVWSFQREITADLREDLHTNQIAIEQLIPMMERAGAEVLTVRERSFQTDELLLDNDGGEEGGYSESGTWTTGGSPGLDGGTYRYAALEPGAGASARWSFTVARSGWYPVYVWFLASEVRTRDAHYRIEHLGGLSERRLDQGGLRVQTGGSPDLPPPSDSVGVLNGRWHYLGTFPFAAGASAAVVLTNEGEDGSKVVIADAVRVGADQSGVTVGGEGSGRPRWEEGAIVHLEAMGMPEWVLSNDVTTRPLYALYEGADAYFALHTNCCNSTGTSTYTWYPEMWIPEQSWGGDQGAAWADTNLPPGTYAWSDAIHRSVIDAARMWEPGWGDSGHLGANFGELRPIKNAWEVDQAEGVEPPVAVPAALMELAFHDAGSDPRLIRELGWRRDVARAMVNGMIRYFDGPDAMVPPLPPAALAATSAERGVRIQWRPADDPLETNAVPQAWRVYVSSIPGVFPPEPALETTELETVVATEPCEPIYVRVTGANAAGESLDGPTVGARQNAGAAPVVLWVDGIDRQVKTVRDPVDPVTIASIVGPALLEVGGDGTFAMATDDAVNAGLVNLADYAVVVWSLGESSRRDSTLDADARARLTAYLDGGGRLIVSGAELGWDLIAAPRDGSDAFMRDILGADYLADDANTNRIEPPLDGPLAGMRPVSYGECTGDTWCVEYADVLGPVGDSAAVILQYEGGAGAAVESTAHGHTITAGFPIESVTDPEKRALLLRLLVEHLAPETLGVEPHCAWPDPDPDPDAGDAGPDADDADTTEDATDTDGTTDTTDATEDVAPDTTGDVAPDTTEDADPPDTHGDHLDADTDLAEDETTPPTRPPEADEGCGCQTPTTPTSATRGIAGLTLAILAASWSFLRRR